MNSRMSTMRRLGSALLLARPPALSGKASLRQLLLTSGILFMQGFKSKAVLRGRGRQRTQGCSG